MAGISACSERHLGRRLEVERELSLIETKTRRLVDAIADGGDEVRGAIVSRLAGA